MEKNFDYYSNLAQKALESGNKEHAEVFMDKTRSLAVSYTHLTLRRRG